MDLEFWDCFWKKKKCLIREEKILMVYNNFYDDSEKTDLSVLRHTSSYVMIPHFQPLRGYDSGAPTYELQHSLSK